MQSRFIVVRKASLEECWSKICILCLSKSSSIRIISRRRRILSPYSFIWFVFAEKKIWWFNSLQFIDQHLFIHPYHFEQPDSSFSLCEAMCVPRKSSWAKANWDEKKKKCNQFRTFELILILIDDLRRLTIKVMCWKLDESINCSLFFVSFSWIFYFTFHFSPFAIKYFQWKKRRWKKKSQTNTVLFCRKSKAVVNRNHLVAKNLIVCALIEIFFLRLVSVKNTKTKNKKKQKKGWRKKTKKRMKKEGHSKCTQYFFSIFQLFE